MTSPSEAGIRWISRAVALAIHDRLLAEHGGAKGILDEGALDAALAAPRNHFHYGSGDLFVVAAVYAHAVTRNHPFCDGNKRLALTLAGVFLERNGYRVEASEREAFTAMQALSDRSIEFEEFAVWLQRNSRKVPRQKARGRP